MANIDYSVTIDENLMIVPSSIKNSSYFASGDKNTDVITITCLNTSITNVGISFRRKDGYKFGEFTVAKSSSESTSTKSVFIYTFTDTRVLAVAGELKFSLKLYEIETTTTTSGARDVVIKRCKATPELSLVVRQVVGDADIISEKDAIVEDLREDIQGYQAELASEIKTARKNEETNATAISTHTSNKNNPHEVNASQVPSNYSEGAGGYISNVEAELQSIKTDVGTLESNEYEDRGNIEELQIKTQDISHSNAQTVINEPKLISPIIDNPTISGDNTSISGGIITSDLKESTVSVIGDSTTSVVNKAYITLTKEDIEDDYTSAIADAVAQVTAAMGSNNHIVDITWKNDDVTDGKIELVCTKANGSTFTRTVDLPAELSFVKVGYDEKTGILTFTLGNGTSTQVALTDIVDVVNSKLKTYADDYQEKATAATNAINEINAKKNEMESYLETVQSNEQDRKDNENTRKSNELTRQNNEAERQTNETNRQNAESARQSTFEASEQLRADTFSASQTDRDEQFTTAQSERSTTFTNTLGSSSDTRSASGTMWARFNEEQAKMQDMYQYYLNALDELDSSLATQDDILAMLEED